MFPEFWGPGPLTTHSPEQREAWGTSVQRLCTFSSLSWWGTCFQGCYSDRNSGRAPSLPAPPPGQPHPPPHQPLSFHKLVYLSEILINQHK